MSQTSILQGVPHPRDQRMLFDTEVDPTTGQRKHDYYVDGKLYQGSVTGFVHDFFPVFDADKVVDRIMASGKTESNPRYKYFGMTRQDILDSWELNRDTKSEAGTVAHDNIEQYTKGNAYDPTHPGIEGFNAFNAEFTASGEWVPWLAEWAVFNEDSGLGGCVDMVYARRSHVEAARKAGTLATAPIDLWLVDWKFTKDFEEVNNYGKTGFGPCEDLPDTNLYHYYCQLNIYRHTVEAQYGRKVIGNTLVRYSHTAPTFQRREVPDMQKMIEQMIRYRIYKRAEEAKNKTPKTVAAWWKTNKPKAAPVPTSLLSRRLKKKPAPAPKPSKTPTAPEPALAGDVMNASQPPKRRSAGRLRRAERLKALNA